MKRAYLLLLAVMLILSGCAAKDSVINISVKDVICPYEIKYKENTVEITLQDGEKSGILWQVQAVPGDICEVTEENAGKEHISRYLLSGKTEGAAQLTFTGVRSDDAVSFVLTLMVNVDSKGNTTVSSYQHQQMQDNVVEADGLNYKWNVDLDGILNFVFINDEDGWSVQSGAEDVCVLTNKMSTPSGCKFSAEAKSAGQTQIVLVGENTQRMVAVTIQVDESGKIEVISVQER